MTLCAIFRRARISRKITYDPSEDLVLPIAEKGTHRSITPDERVFILKLAETNHAGLWVKTILRCGLRPIETRSLDWGNIDFENKQLYIKKSKTPSGIRHVPIPDDIYKDLLAAKGNPSEPVFKQPKAGNRHTKSSMRCLWLNFKRELDTTLGAKIYRNQIIESVVAPDLVPYCLRHTYCTDLQDAGVPINVAKTLMGHSDIKTTANIYTHTTEKALQDAAKKINAHDIKETVVG